MPQVCPERAKLSKTVVDAIAEVYRAAEAYDTAKRNRNGNVNELATALATARKAERAANRAFGEHIKAHGCKDQYARGRAQASPTDICYAAELCLFSASTASLSSAHRAAAFWTDTNRALIISNSRPSAPFRSAALRLWADTSIPVHNAGVKPSPITPAGTGTAQSARHRRGNVGSPSESKSFFRPAIFTWSSPCPTN
jgi:hypothetical protein